MVKGETGTLSLDVRTSVDKGVSPFREFIKQLLYLISIIGFISMVCSVLYFQTCPSVLHREECCS